MTAQLRALSARLRIDGSRAAVTAELRKELAKAARPFAPRLRAAIINTPAYGTKHTGLRVRISKCVQTWAEIHGDLVSVGVEVNSARMRDGQKSLPLMLEGAKPWRHPVYGDMSNWVSQLSHPYFHEATALMGPAGRRAVERASDNIAAKIEGQIA